MKHYIQRENIITMSRCDLHKNGIMLDMKGVVEVCCQTIPHFDVDRPIWENVLEFETNYKSNGKDFEAFEKSKTQWLDGCHGCRLDEEKFGMSGRNVANTVCNNANNATHNHIQHAIINPGNHCNLACRMCDTGPSSKWGSLAREFPNKWMKDQGLVKHNKLTKSYVKNKVLTKHLRQLTFAGGEPLLSKTASEYLEYMLENNVFDYLTELHLITNGTFALTDVWKESFRKSNRVSLSFSMDGTGDNYNYIREYADFAHVLNNISNIVEEFQGPTFGFTVTYCLQAANAHKWKYDEEFFNNWMSKYHTSNDNILKPNVITYPSYLSLSCVHPDLIKKYGIEKEAVGFNFSLDDYKEFMTFMGFWDYKFGKSLEEQNPDFFDNTYYPNGREYYDIGKNDAKFKTKR